MVAVFFTFMVMGMRLESPGENPVLNDRLVAIVEFLVDHPALETPPVLGSFLGEDFLEQRRRSMQRFRASYPRSAEEMRRDQETLQELTDPILTIVEASTSYTFGFVPGRPRLLGLLTHMFVHAGWFHLIGNMLFFFVVGPYLEEAYGWVFLLLLYFASGLAAVGAHLWRFPGSMTPVVGASGAIAGVMGAFLVLLGTSRIRMLFLPVFFLPIWRFTFMARAFIVLPIWFFFQLVEARGASSTGGVAYFAHIGGFCFGAAAGAILKFTPLERLLRKPIGEERPPKTSRPGTSPEARGEASRTGPIVAPPVMTPLRSAPRETTAPLPPVEDPRVWSAALDRALDSANETEAVRCAERLLAAYAGRGDIAAAYELLREMGRRLPQGFSARWGLEAADLLSGQGEIQAALDWYAEVVRRYPGEAASLRALVKAGELLRRAGDERGAGEILQQARAHPLCDAQWASRIDQIEGR